ncbi:DnaJ-domain-containing protein [Hypoxylon rubiginosum]|uniref:DnaJ-domain-containing protein n=1 Tax=Hypoxylon rubiginosum TaxID=110542 RepID=A0ACC0DH84_9PEZI|nr:DnaJ-domain-containing protein [Hypoxylon rubiginosum]
MSRPDFPKGDLYKVLGIDSNATLDDIKKAYRDLCLKVHPDKAEGGNTPENNERFQRVQEAWEILRDDVLRKEYDDYRANGSKYRDDSRRKTDSDSDDAGRRRKDDRKDRSGKQRKSSRRSNSAPGKDRWRDRANYYGYPEGDTSYGSKPGSSDRSKPYYEEWGDDFYDPGYESGHSQHHHHRHHTGSFYYGAGAQNHGSHDEYRRPRSSEDSGTPPPRPIRLEDRIIAMRMRVDLRHAGEELDNLHEALAAIIKTFSSTFKLSMPEQDHVNRLFDNVHRAIEHAEDLYDDLHLRLKEVETGHWIAPTVVLDLPEVLGILMAHVTRMKYAASATLTILGQLAGFHTPASEGQLMDSFQERLVTMARPAWLPTYLRSS